MGFESLKVKAEKEHRSINNMAEHLILNGKALPLNEARILYAYINSEEFVAPKPYPQHLKMAFTALEKYLEELTAD